MPENKQLVTRKIRNVIWKPVFLKNIEANERMRDT